MRQTPSGLAWLHALVVLLVLLAIVGAQIGRAAPAEVARARPALVAPPAPRP